MIQVEGLTKRYGQRLAVNQLSFQANKGEIVGFLGPNGAGKTTTMRMLTGYLPATAGKAVVAGYDVFAESLEARSRVGYLPETVPLYPEMTLWQYLDFMGELRDVPNRDDRIEEVMDMVQMADRADSLIGSLSKGMRQRVGLAQAILHDPEVLILDEPTIGLDPGQVRDLRNLISHLGQDRTVMLSTHILSEAQQVCNRILIINKGQIVAEDSTEQLQQRFMGQNQVTLKVRGDADAVPEVLAGIEGVVQARASAGGVLTIDLAPGKEARPEIARRVIERGFDLMEMHARDVSLEDIYLELVRAEAAAAQPVAAPDANEEV